MTGRPAPLDRDALDRLAAAKIWLITTSSPRGCGNLPYLATALYALIPVATTRVREVTVDRLWRLYVNPSWILATDVPVIAAHLAHLTWHLLGEHADRGEDLEVRRANAKHWKVACDATIAEITTDLATGLDTAGDLGLTPGRSAEEYFAQLSGLAVIADDREEGDDSDVPREQQPDDGDDSCGSGCDAQHRDYELPPSDDIGGVGQAHGDDIRRRVAIEFREHQTRIGTTPGQWDRWVQQVLEPVVPWSQVLAAAVRRGVGWAHGHTDYTYTKISRRQAAAGRIILPATRRPLPEVAVVVDTSGSVDDGLLARALGEVDGVLTGMGVAGRSVTVLATDAAVHAVSQVRAAADVRLGGGGGTDMGVGIEAAVALKPRPTLIIVMTDGYTPWPASAPAIPVVAVIIGRLGDPLPSTPGWAERVECQP